MGTESEIQLPLIRSSRFQRLFPTPNWLVLGRASRHQRLAPTFPWIDSCLKMVTKWDFLEIIIMNFYSPVSNNKCHSIGHEMRIARIKIRVDSPGRWEFGA